MIDNEIKEKQAQLEKGIRAWENMKAEISELNTMKTNLVKDINIQLIDAKSKADKIIQEAKDTAKKIIDDAERSKLDIDNYVSTHKKDIEDLLLLSKHNSEKLGAERDSLSKDIAEFNNLKASQEADIKGKCELIRDSEIKNDLRQGELDNMGVELYKKETALKIESDRLEALNKLLISKQEKIDLDRIELDTNISDYKKNKLLIDEQKAINEKTLVNLNSAQDKIIADAQINREAFTEIYNQKIWIAEQKKTINTQFDLLEKNRKELEEKSQSLDERTQLLVIKDRDIENKIKILQEIRLKTGVK